MDLHPCPACGSVDVSWESTLVDGGSRRYAGACGGCGAAREFVFGEPDPSVFIPDFEPVVFGGQDPSVLIDAGEWMWVGDLSAQVATGVVVDPYGATVPDQQARESLAVAVAAMNEILKFLPDGAAEVPESAFWSDRGREVRAAAPGRFQRRRLHIVRDSYRDRLDGVPAR
jgi:hypothetical protein